MFLYGFILIFFLNDTATTEIYTLSLHDALPISFSSMCWYQVRRQEPAATNARTAWRLATRDRKSTRLNSSHGYISYAVFCLKKNKLYCDTRLANSLLDTCTIQHLK